jgi:hypothetical protein
MRRTATAIRAELNELDKVDKLIHFQHEYYGPVNTCDDLRGAGVFDRGY